ncbi:MAG: hypothetical protein N3G79_03635, partial [Sulfolobales archaeon]|nr:hypothetical protein [Sulfolobales archaeon]
ATDAQVEYAVFSIAYVGGRLVVVRGLDRGLAAFPDSGELCYYCAVVGGELAEDLNVSEGSLLPLHSVLSGRSVLIYVYRVEDLPPPYRYEVLCGTDLVRELRGIGKNSYSIAVVKSENLSVLRELAAKLGIGESEVGILRRALLVLTQRGLRTVLEVRKDLPEVYIGRLGIHRELLYYLTYSTAAVSMLCLPIAGETVVRVGKVAARTLRSIGVSRARLTLALAAQASLYSTISITLATATTRILSSYLVFKILSYSVTPATRIGEVLMVAAIQVALLSLGVLWGIREHVE